MCVCCSDKEIESSRNLVSHTIIGYSIPVTKPQLFSMKFNLFLLLRKDLEQSMPKGNTLNSKWLFKGYSLYSITHL